MSVTMYGRTNYLPYASRVKQAPLPKFASQKNSTPYSSQQQRFSGCSVRPRSMHPSALKLKN